MALPNSYVDRSVRRSCILFICRLHIDGDQFYPVDHDNSQRCLGAILGVESVKVTSIITMDATFSARTCIAPKRKLMDYSAWTNRDS